MQADLINSVAVLVQLQRPGLPDPVFAINPATKTLQLLSDTVDVVFRHFGNLHVTENSEVIEQLFDCRADALDLLEIIVCVHAGKEIIARQIVKRASVTDAIGGRCDVVARFSMSGSGIILIAGSLDVVCRIVRLVPRSMGAGIIRHRLTCHRW
jgi:hypothetical protein